MKEALGKPLSPSPSALLTNARREHAQATESTRVTNPSSNESSVVLVIAIQFGNPDRNGI